MCLAEVTRCGSPCEDRGLKPTATIVSSLRDEEEMHRNYAAERHLMVAVGFSPRTGADAEPRRVATIDPAIGPAIHRSCVATRRPPISRSTRGLKPTATVMSSLRDENPPADLILSSCAGQSLVRYTLPSNVLACEYRLVLSDQTRLAKELTARKTIDRRYAP